VVAALAALILELRPGIAPSIADSLVVEALDQAAGAILDEAWARAREHMYPDAIAAARTAARLPDYLDLERGRRDLYAEWARDRDGRRHRDRDGRRYRDRGRHLASVRTGGEVA
jgi:hypothetical protein